MTCCNGQHDSIWDWFRRTSGAFGYVHVVVKVGQQYMVMRQGGSEKIYRCHCGKWSRGWDADLLSDPGKHPEYEGLRKMHPQPDSEEANTFAMRLTGAFGGVVGTYWDPRDAQAVADKLNKGIPLNWPLWAAIGFGVLQVIAIIVEAIY